LLHLRGVVDEDLRQGHGALVPHAAFALAERSRTRSTSHSWMRPSSVSSGWNATARMLPSRTAIGWPSISARTSTPAPYSSTHGARMKTAHNGPPSIPSSSTSASKLFTWRPNALRSARTSSRSRWSRSSMIRPAQVPSVGVPARTSSRSGSARPSRSMPSVIVVDSPPGMTSPSSPSRSAGVRTMRASAPRWIRTPAWASKSPWRASTPTTTALPAAMLDQALFAELRDLKPGHRGTQAARGARHALRVVVVGGGLHNRGRHALGVLRLEDPGADEDALGAELHHQRGVRRGGDAARGEVDDRQAAFLGDHAHQLDGRLKVLGGGWDLRLVERAETANLAHDRAHVAHGLDHVAGARLALGADHRGALGDAAERLAQVGGAADERHLELPLVDVVRLVGRGEDLGLVDVVDLERLQHLRLGEVADARLRHHGDGDGGLDLVDLRGVRHAGHAAVRADV